MEHPGKPPRPTEFEDMEVFEAALNEWRSKMKKWKESTKK